MIEKYGIEETETYVAEENVEAFIRQYVNSVRFQAAKSKQYEKVPHEYTIKEWNPAKNATFEEVARLIRKYGYPEKFYRKTFYYYAIDGKKYWTMGNPIWDTNVLNRADVENVYK